MRLRRGATAAVELDLGDDGVVRSLGRVVRSVPLGGEYDLGIQFIDLAESERERLADALVRRVLSPD